MAMIRLRTPSPVAIGLWLGELPEAAFVAAKENTLELGAQPMGPRPATQAAAEVSIIYGPRADYGLLGASFTPDDTQRLLAYIPELPDIPDAVDGGPRYAGESVRGHATDGRQVGLPREYVNAVALGAASALEKSLLGGGVIRFDRAVHHPVDSNARTFAALTALVLRLLQPDGASIDRDKLAALALAYLRP